VSRPTVFIADGAAVVRAGRLSPQVIPALLALREAGVRLVGGPGLEADEARAVLTSQGLELEAFRPGEAFDAPSSLAVASEPAALAWAEAVGLATAPAQWPEVALQVLTRCSQRRATLRRTTRETEVDVTVDLDREGRPHAATGIGFFDHMLEQLGAHGGFTLAVTVKGDLDVDEHHTVEDTALALGEALRRALGDKRGIGRYGFTLPMDEALADVALDLAGRALLRFSGAFPRESVGGLPTEMVPHFFKSLADGLGATLHVTVRGENAHHMVEACFKAVGRCLRQACARDGSTALPSTKGVL
jgi:imidazoleglycerol-phosphate dehydratase/histidinol-phosphatase